MRPYYSSSSAAGSTGLSLDYPESSTAVPGKQGVAENQPEGRVPQNEDTKLHPQGQVRIPMNLHLALLSRRPDRDELNEIAGAPLFTEAVKEHAESLASGNWTVPFAQYALLAGESDSLQKTAFADPRIFYNVAAPSSVFICGSQGSGKSHTLSCLLESCLIPFSGLGQLPKPLTGIVFHYDTFVSDTSGTPCEAAFLASDPRVKVRVLCAPTNIRVIEDTYRKVGNVTVEELKLGESHLNTKRMLDLMAFGDGNQPLYMQVIQRILRDMRVIQQHTRSGFDYNNFLQRLSNEKLTTDQRRPLNQRLETLESFLAKPFQAGNYYAQSPAGTDWTPKSGELIIVDLSCPCVTANMACSLFNICMSIFLEQDSAVGRFVALDEAHKYMGETAECQALTNTLLSTIRLQRHLGARVFISTQEPTISPKLLDLCSVTIVHRFTSPDWLRVLTNHLAGISKVAKVANMMNDVKKKQQNDEQTGDEGFVTGFSGMAISSETPIFELFAHIVKLKTGEALLFSPSSVLGLEKRVVEKDGEGTAVVHRRLAHDVLRIVMRARITADGGRSIMAN